MKVQPLIIMLCAGTWHCAGAAEISDAGARAGYLTLLENFAGWSEQYWNEQDQAFAAKGRGVTWARGNGNVCVGYAVLLTQRPGRKQFSKNRISRDLMIDRVRRTLRTLCLTNKNCTHPDRAKKPRWGGVSWQSGLETSAWAWAAWLLRDQLDEDTRALVRQVVTAEADRIIKEVPSRVHNDTGSEDCVWNTALAGVAANFYPDDSRASSWDEWAKRWALNALSRQLDRSSKKIVDGRPLADWLVSVNVHPDLTIENHGFWSVPYQADLSGFAEAELAYKVSGKPVPEAYGLHARALWEDVLSWLVLPDGDLLCPQGQDWAERDIQHVWCYAWLAACHGIDAARAAEQWGVEHLLRRQKAFGDGSLRAYDFGYQTHHFKRWAFAALMHEHFPAGGGGGVDTAAVGKLGARVFPHVGVAVYRCPALVSSVSWDDSRQTALVVPNDRGGLDEDPTFTSYHRLSGLGWVQLVGKKQVESDYRIREKPVIAREAGALTVSFVREVPGLVRQRVGFAALPDGPVVVSSRWEALADGEFLEVVSHPFFWVRIDGLVPKRQVKPAGEGAWNVANRLNMKVIGGLGGVVQAGGVLGSARMTARSARAGQVLDESVCVYQGITGQKPMAVVADGPRKVRVGDRLVEIDADGAITLKAPPGG